MQEPLPNIAKQIPAIEVAAKDFLAARDMRMDAQEEENKFHDILLVAMKSHSVEYYRTLDGHDCILDHKEKVKIKSPKEREK